VHLDWFDLIFIIVLWLELRSLLKKIIKRLDRIEGLDRIRGLDEREHPYSLDRS
jgi:hypothetical protein